VSVLVVVVMHKLILMFGLFIPMLNLIVMMALLIIKTYFKI